MTSFLSTRKARIRVAAVVGASFIAVLAVIGSGDPPSTTADTTGQALAYVTSHRLDLGAPGLAVGVVDQFGMHGASAGDLTTDTPIPVGSVTKSITAMAVLQLAEAQRIRLDDPAVTYLPDFGTSDHTVSDRITVRQLLSHTSGIPTAAGVDPLSGPVSTMHAQVSALRHVTAAPAGRFSYSNANYEVLGALVEQISGQSYAAYVQTHIFQPLDMVHTYTDLASAEASGQAQGHRILFGLGIPTGTFYRPDFLPAGFVISTASDLQHLAAAILDRGSYRGHSILSPAGIQTMLAPTTTADAFGIPGGYGLGWYQRRTAGVDLNIDPGIAQNIHADLVLVPSRHVGVVLLSDAESDLYVGTIPRFDLAAINAATIAAGGAPAGLIEGYYLIFDILVLTAVLIYGRTLVQVVRQRRPWYRDGRWYRVIFNMWREILVPLVLLVQLQRVFHEPWSYLLTGDVGFAVALISALGIASLAARSVFGLQVRPIRAATPTGHAGDETWPLPSSAPSSSAGS